MKQLTQSTARFRGGESLPEQVTDSRHRRCAKKAFDFGLFDKREDTSCGIGKRPTTQKNVEHHIRVHHHPHECFLRRCALWSASQKCCPLITPSNKEVVGGSSLPWRQPRKDAIKSPNICQTDFPRRAGRRDDFERPLPGLERI